MQHSEIVERERELDRLLSFTKEEQDAYRMVLVFLCAVGMILERKGADIHHLNRQDLHRYFALFANELGLGGAMYADKNGKVLAVSLYLHEDQPGRVEKFYVMKIPLHHARWAPWRVNDREDFPQILEAALNVCKAWLVHWTWEETLVTRSA